MTHDNDNDENIFAPIADAIRHSQRFKRDFNREFPNNPVFEPRALTNPDTYKAKGEDL